MIRQLTAILLAAAFALPSFGNRVANGGAGGGVPAWSYSMLQGVDDDADENSSAGTQLATRVVAGQSGSITKIGIWVKFVNASTSVKFACYNTALNLLGSKSGTIGGGDGQWHDLTLDTPIAGITAGDVLWLGQGSNGPFDGSCVYRKKGTLSNSLKADFGSYASFPPSSISSWSTLNQGLLMRVEITP